MSHVPDRMSQYSSFLKKCSSISERAQKMEAVGDREASRKMLRLKWHVEDNAEYICVRLDFRIIKFFRPVGHEAIGVDRETVESFFTAKMLL